MKNKKIGWIGLGKMGQPMSGQLLKAGYPVYVYGRSEQDTQAMAAKGAVVSQSVLDLVNIVDILFLMVTDDHAIEDIFKSEAGVLSAGLTGKTIVNMSTVSPAINREMAELCKEKGAFYLDAPVSGSIKQAEEAKLVIMAGGEEAVYESIKPLFGILGGSSSLIGEIGAGNLAKLSINTLLAIQAQGLAEVVNFAEHHNISAEKMMSIINNGALGSVFMKLKGELIINENYNPAFALKLLTKDLRLAKAEGLDSPLGNTVCKTFQQAEAEFGNEDLIAVKKYL